MEYSATNIYPFPYLRFRDYYESRSIKITRNEGQEGPVQKAIFSAYRRINELINSLPF